DEVGRGALMGPVVTAAVSFPHYPLPLEVQEALRVANDSKTLKATQREALYHLILTHAHVGIGWANAEEVDQWNIHRATLLAFYRAVHHLWHQHGTPQQCSLLVDGIHALPAYWFEAQPTSPLLRQWTMVQGDQRSLSIACASIVAKHLRDTWAETLSTTYPLYRPFAWEKNKGYGSTEHREALQQYGATLFHRNTFLKKLEVNPTLFKVPTSLDTDTSAFVLPQGLSVGFGLETQRPVTFP
ncbi:MAG: ribonuclease HII, partial [Vampirovibrionales bacterium]